MNNKGQSALEYLMTYGWALVVIVIVVAALFAFGIFNPPAAGTCTGLNKLAYKDHDVNANDGFTLIVANGNIGRITLNPATDITLGGDFLQSPAVLCSSITSVAVGDELTIYCNNAFTTTGSYSGTVTIAYAVAGGTTHSETATCTGSG